MNLEQRLERLERENRWLQRIGAVGIVAVIVALFLVARCGEELVAESLALRDGEGAMKRASPGPEVPAAG